MFNEWLTVAYKHDQEKTASRQFLNRLHALPIEELRKAAAGDPTSKLAYVDGPSDERDSWIGKYKGSPLFQKAVELEKALLQIDMEENQRRAEENAEPKASSDSYERKDAIKLQQRMLDLDLAMEGAGAENPEAKEEEGVQLLEQAQQQEAAAGEGNEPHEKAEDAAIQQFRGAQQQEAAAPAKTEVKVGSIRKVAGTLGSDTRRVAPSTNNEVLHGGSTQGAGALGDFQPTTDDHLSNVSEGLQVNKTAAVHSLASIDSVGRLLAKTAAGDPEGHHIRRELLGNTLSSAIEAKKGKKLESAGKAWWHGAKETLKGTGIGAAGGGALGAGLGALQGGRQGAAKGAVLGMQQGAGVGAGVGAIKGRHDAEASHIHGEHSKHKAAAALTENQREHISTKNFALPHGGPNGKPAYPVEDPKHARLAVSMVDTHGSPSEKSKVHALVAKKYPALAARSSVPDVAEKGHKALKKAAEAHKEAGIGASLATAGQKALTAGKGMLSNAGGVSGLASKGLGLAKANPLATAGIAGAAGLAGGAMLGHHKQAALDLHSLKNGVATAPLG